MNLNLATFSRLTYMRKVCGVLPNLENGRKIETVGKIPSGVWLGDQQDERLETAEVTE